MSTNKHLDKICIVGILLAIVITVAFCMGDQLGIKQASTVMAYENKLFDTTTVHTLDITMDNWDKFIATATNEEYSACTVTIDGETYANVGLRAKGNTSLTQVAAYGNDRYSFKIEFDHYDSGLTYHGLDKLCLNNIIQDNTYMKDYLVYQMMGDFGVASPLCSYTYITVNGEDWGLYLAVEGVEESFLQRNYGKNYGELYKPDSMSMGGGRGNGKDFDQEKVDENFNQYFDKDFDEKTDENFNENIQPDNPDDFPSGGFQPNGEPPQMPDNSQPGEQGNFQPEDFQPGEKPDFQPDNKPDFQPADFGENNSEPKRGGGHAGGGMMGGSDDVLLKYIDDDVDSYANIFDNAKTNPTTADKNRLISALQTLSGDTPTDALDVDAVLRYFVVHNFVLNFDSYTGSMIHNYYLYEQNGKLAMLPWDYNLAFGGFQQMGGADSLINYPIDTPVSGGELSDRPMLAWIFANDENIALYHQYFAEFIDDYFNTSKFTQIIDDVTALIAPYVEQDPTKFCTYDEFTEGVATLRKFCLLRAESVKAQLNGTLGSTGDTQNAEDFVTSDDELAITAMGSMNHGGGDMPTSNGEKPDNMPEMPTPNDENRGDMPNFPNRPDENRGNMRGTPPNQPQNVDKT